MKLDKKISMYNNEVSIAKFKPKKESIRFEKTNNIVSIGDGSIIIEGNLETGKLGKKDSIFGLKEDGSPLIETMDKLEESDFEIIFKGNPRIVHEGKLKINSLEEDVEKSTVYSLRPRLAIGYTESGEVVIVALSNPGLTVKQLGQLMLQLKCVEAINVYGKNVGKIEDKSNSVEDISLEKISAENISSVGNDDADKITSDTIKASDIETEVQTNTKKPTSNSRKRKPKSTK
jgi:hypothetical protein